MLEVFKPLYDRHCWLRYGTWGALLSSTLLLLWLPGGFPLLQGWFLIQAIAHFSATWHTWGLLACLLLIWPPASLGIWCILFWLYLKLGRYHYRQQRLRAHIRSEGWIPSQELSLAASVPGGHMSMHDIRTTALPRLRLPQKAITTPLPAQHLHPHDGSAFIATPAYDVIADLPTRPAGQKRTAKLHNVLYSTPPLQVGVGWSAGIERRHEPNEDSVVVLQGMCSYHEQLLPFGLFVVADGMGGHAHGQEASRIAIHSMMYTVLQNTVMGNELSDAYLADMLIGGVEWANMAVYQQGQLLKKDMGTTLTAALVVGMKAYVVNVGDSRTYLYREGAGLKQLTNDHSLVASLVKQGKIRPDEIYTHPERNKIYRSLGQETALKVDCFETDLCTHDRLLLCSDGLWEMVRDPALERILRGGEDATQVSDRLVQTALRGGGVDNVSAIVVCVAPTLF